MSELLAGVGFGSVERCGATWPVTTEWRWGPMTAVEAGPFERCMSVGEWPCSRPTPCTGWPATCTTGSRSSGCTRSSGAGWTSRRRSCSSIWSWPSPPCPSWGSGRGRPWTAAARGGHAAVAQPERRFPLACGEDGRRRAAGAGGRPARGRQMAGAAVQREPGRGTGGGSAGRRARGDPWRADLVIDGGELPGWPRRWSTSFVTRQSRTWEIVRPGAVPEDEVRAALEWQFHFDPASYLDMIRDRHPRLRPFQEGWWRRAGRARRACWSWAPGPGRPRGVCSTPIPAPPWSGSTRAPRCWRGARGAARRTECAGGGAARG